MRGKPHWLLAATGGALVVACAALGVFPDLTRHIGSFLLLMALAFSAWGITLWWICSARATDAGDGAHRGRGLASRTVLGLVFGVAVVARVVMLPARPAVSTDVYRYAWEGRVVLHRVNPFAVAPDDSSLVPLRDNSWNRINHRDLVTIYPPVAQAVFALGAWIHRGTTSQKALFCLFDLATMIVLFRALRRRGESGLWSIAYGWNPLVIFETAHSGHLDAMGAFFLVVAIVAVQRGRMLRGALSLGASIASKYLAVVFVPWVVLHGHGSTRSRGRVKFLGLCALFVAVVYVPFAGAGANLISSLRVYSEQWHFNGLPFYLLSHVWGNPTWIRRALGIAAAVAIGVLVRREKSPARFARRAISTVLILTPTLYPWYLIQIAPLLVLDRSRAWLVLMATSFLSYTVWTTYYTTGRWEMSGALLVAEFTPFYGLLLFDAVRSARIAARDRKI